jgi:head-tail adaptor
VEIQESAIVRGAQGSRIDVWTTVATRWARITEGKNEQFIVDIRYFEGLVPTAVKKLDEEENEIPVNRLKHQARILNIQDVIDMKAMKQLVRVVCIRDDETFVGAV